ncbi:MAG TPA: hypothetical protein VKA82_03675 [Rubrobacter sp.]|jgi:hypothetical protein|nr:hypothetical protein [Rubrobacter sp.]
MTATTKGAPTEASIGTEHQGAARKVGYFLWHLLQMVLAMMAGMAVYKVTFGVLLAPAVLVAYPLLKYPVMFAFMTPPMVALMRYHGYNWRRTTEMVGAMIGPPAVLVVLVLCGLSAFLPLLSVGTLRPLTHIAMLVGMVAWMIYRRGDVEHLGHHRSDHRAGYQGTVGS